MSDSKSAKVQELSFEESLERLEEIVGRLETGDAPLEQGLTLFEEGVALTKRCHQLLTTVEERVQLLVKDGDGTLSLDLFPGAGDEDTE